MKRIFSMLCVLALMLGMIAVPAYAADAEGAVQQKQVVLSANAENLTVEEDTYIDLNGYSIAGVTVADGATLYAYDSKTDDYTVTDGSYGKITDAEGAVQAAQGYVAINENGAVSYHKVDLTLTSMTLRPAAAGVYYNSAFAADEVVTANVECYGVALSVVEEPTAENLETLCGYSTIYGFEAGEKSGTLLSGIMTEGNTDFANNRNASMAIYGRAYIKTADGYIFGATASRDLKTQVEAIDAVFAKLNETQKNAIVSMYDRYESVMESWNVPNMKHYAAANPMGDTVITIPVTVEDDMVAESVTVEQDGVSITIPFGTLVESGELTLTVTRKTESDSGIEAEDDQTLMPFDVHVDGVSAENTQPLTVELGKVMPENLNMGNYTVYHVEEDGTNAMELISNDADFTDHNQYKYTLDGELTLHMATFSEIAALAENENVWNGDRDYSWYDADAETLYIRNADQLAGFGAIVGGMDDQTQDSFAGKTVVLLADINIGDLTDDQPDAGNKTCPDGSTLVFYPIGYNSNDGKYKKTGAAVSTGFYAFMGTFDGNGNTISNFYQNTWEMKGDHNWYDASLQYYRDGMGLFGKVYGGTVKNLTVDNFSCDGEITTTGVIAAYADCGATFENIAITNCNPRVYNIGNGGIVGCAGWYATADNSQTPITFKNITVDQTNKISALWGTYDVSCGGILGQYYSNSGQTGSPKNGQIHFINCHVAAIIDVNNDVCANYQYYWYRYSGMLMGTVRANKTEGGYTVADTSDIVAENCTYTYGSWNEYWYCELVKNSSASYTHDYQFGRLTNIDDISEIKSGETWLKEGNFALVSDDRKSVECYHIFKNSEGNLYRHFHDVADESNPKIYEDFDLDGNGQLDDLKEDRQRYYLPFGQVLNGLGYGVKPTYELEGFTLVEDGSVISGPKFQQKADANLSYEPGDKVYLKDLVNLIVDESKLSQSSLYAAASPVNEEDTVTVTYSRDVENWENNYVTFSEDTQGAVKLVITDYFYCEPTVIYLNVGVAESVEKFQATVTTNVPAEKTITLGELFTEIADVTDASVEVTVAGGTFEFVKNEADWTQSTVTFAETATYTLTITDADNCIPTERTVTVDPIDKFALVFENTDKYLYRVGNKDGSTVALNLLFKALDGVTVDSADIEFNTVAGNASGTYTSSETWNNGTIQFSGTGVVKVTITTTNANPLILNLEVVEAKNVTTAESATANNVVLLKDCSSSGFTVSEGYAFYGNGFKVTCSGKGTYLNTGGLYRGYVNVESGGLLDNVQVICDIYPVALMYASEVTNYKDEVASTADRTRNMYQLSAIAISGDGSKISNSYAYGGRDNIYVGDGNVTIVNTTAKNGVLANIQMKNSSASTVILDNITTIQEKVVSTYDTTKTMIGCGILVGDPTTSVSNPNIVFKNAWNHYNWVTQADADAVSNDYAKDFIEAALGETDYLHTRANGNTVNLGMIVLNALNIDIEDQRTVKSNYLLSDVYMDVAVDGQDVTLEAQVYSVAAGKGDPNVTAPIYDPTTNIPVIPVGTKDTTVAGNYDANAGGDDVRYCYWDGELLKLMYQENKSAFTLDVNALIAFEKHTHTLNKTAVVTKNGTVIPAVNGKVTFSEAGTYVVTYTVEDYNNYDKDAVQLADPVQWEISYEVEVSVVKSLGKNAEINVTTTSFYGNYGDTGLFNGSDYHYCIPFMRDVTITDYAEDGVTASTFDVMKNIISITTEGDKTSGTVTFTYLDGRSLIVSVASHSVGLGSTGNTISVKSYSSQLWICTDGVSNNATTATWLVTSYKFTGNNGVPVSYTTTRTCNFDSSSTTNSPKPSWSSYAAPTVDTIKYTVTYNANGGSCTKLTAYTTAGVTSVTLPKPTYSGKIFNGWYDAASGGNLIGKADAIYTPSANITLYAQWSEPCYVTYNANGGNCDTTKVYYNGTALTLPTATRDGYWFAGWYDAASGGNVVGNAGAEYYPDGEITLYAHWQEKIEYTVNYDANGGTCGTASATYQGTALTLPTPNTRTGYTFIGWYTAASNGTKVGEAGTAYTPSANITLYAQWQVKSYKINVTTSNASVKVNGTAVGNSSSISIPYGTQVIVEVTYSKTNSKTTTIKGADNTVYTSPFTMPAQEVNINASSKDSCVSSDTMVNLADGTQKRIDEVTHEDQLLVWNFFTGDYDVVPAAIIFYHGHDNYRILELAFSDGTTVKVVNNHGFFDEAENCFVYIEEENVEDYIGHKFAQMTDDGVEFVELVGYEIYEEYTGSYSIQTAVHINFMVEGMFSNTIPPIVGWFDYFEIGEGMKYDEEKMQADIEKYGLYTYEDFSDYVTYEQFIAFNGPYLKVLVGRGVLTYEDILALIATYVN